MDGTSQFIRLTSSSSPKASHEEEEGDGNSTEGGAPPLDERTENSNHNRNNRNRTVIHYEHQRPVEYEECPTMYFVNNDNYDLEDDCEDGHEFSKSNPLDDHQNHTAGDVFLYLPNTTTTKEKYKTLWQEYSRSKNYLKNKQPRGPLQGRTMQSGCSCDEYVFDWNCQEVVLLTNLDRMSCHLALREYVGQKIWIDWIPSAADADVLQLHKTNSTTSSDNNNGGRHISSRSGNDEDGNNEPSPPPRLRLAELRLFDEISKTSSSMTGFTAHKQTRNSNSNSNFNKRSENAAIQPPPPTRIYSLSGSPSLSASSSSSSPSSRLHLRAWKEPSIIQSDDVTSEYRGRMEVVGVQLDFLTVLRAHAVRLERIIKERYQILHQNRPLFEFERQYLQDVKRVARGEESF